MGTTTGGFGHGPAPFADLEAGQMVGEYRIEGLLGEGGMGRVYSSTHPVIAKRAAIKVLHPELSVNREAVERFVQEARSVNQIGHPNIVDIFSFGTMPDGRCYFVMEWLRGESLRDRLRKSALPVAQSLAVLETVAIALEAAHETGIVHRDLKPDNIFLVDVKGTQPTVKLLDFGIAKLLGNDSDRVEKTRTGNLLGTPAYISPEQARGQSVDHRTDIYALGCLAYELLTGWLPFPAESAADMIAKHLYEPPPRARDKNPSVPIEIENLLVAMLAKDVAQRPTLEQFRAAIAPFRAMSFGAPGPGGISQIHTPVAMPIAAPPGAFTTPPPQYPSGPTGSPTGMAPAAVMQTGIGYTTSYPAPSKSKLPLILGGVLLVVGAAVAVVIAMGTGGKPAVVETKPVETKAAETKAIETKAADTKPVETKPVETKPVETKPVETKPVETKPADTAGTTPVDTKPADTKPADTKPVATKTVDTKPIVQKPAGVKKPGGKKPAGKKPGKPVDDDDAAM
jgi:serine/threonine-protein kinase